MMFRRNGNGARGQRLTDIPAAPDAGASAPLSTAAGRTIIGAHTRIRGTLRGNGPLLVQGSLQGEIDLSGDLIVSPGGSIEAEVDVQSIDLAGRASGSLRASSRVHIGPTGCFEGQMATPIIDLHPGSVLRGRATIAGPAGRRKE